MTRNPRERMQVARTVDQTSSNGPAPPLTKADISCERINRRALLSTLIVAGFVAAAMVGGVSASERRRKVAPGRRMRGPHVLGQAKKQLPNPYGSAVKQINKQKLKVSCPGGYATRKGCLFDF
jgi:hypothetical protein